MDQHEYQKADDIFQKAIRVDPKNAVLLVRRALLVLQSSADVEKGLKYIHQALELDNKCEFAYETLGTIEVQRLVLNLPDIMEYKHMEVLTKLHIKELTALLWDQHQL